MTETIALEVAPEIRVLLVAPGSFRTEGIYGQTYFTGNHIAYYDELRQASIVRFRSIAGTERGDPDKAMEAVVDVVRGEGVARGRPFPRYLILGDDGEKTSRLYMFSTPNWLSAFEGCTNGPLYIYESGTLS